MLSVTTLSRSPLHTILLLAGALALGCGGSAAPAAHATTPAAPRLPPLPTEAFGVLPDGARSFLMVDVAGLRASAHFGYARAWLAAACYPPERQALLLERTARIVTAQWAGDASAPKERSLFVAQGRFEEADVERALQLVRPHADPAEASLEKQHGRYRLRSRGPLAATRLGDALLVVGDPSLVERALALADGAEQPRFIDGALIQATGTRAELDASHALLVMSPDEKPLQRIGRMLGTVGLPKDAVAGTAVVSARAGETVALQVRITKPDAASASYIADAVRAKLGQLGFLARLAGLPPILDRLQIGAEGPLVRANVEATAGDLAAIDERLRSEFGNTQCAP